MIDSRMQQIEQTIIRIRLGCHLTLNHVRWLRGSMAKLIDRPEFHHHTSAGLVYKHPLIRYAVQGDEAYIMGLAAGAFLLRAVPRIETLHLGTEEYPVLERRQEVSRFALGPVPAPVIYHFTAPYLALNQENYALWQCSDLFSRRALLQRVVVGNLLSLSKAIGLDVSERLQAEVELEPSGFHELKPGVRLLGFQGAIRINFALPNFWGIGKSSARGFGTLISEEGNHGASQDEN